MNLHALDDNGSLVAARRAERQQDYACLECGGVVRLRAGPSRQPHFYHLQPTASCRQSGKSETHLQVQHYLQERLPEGEVELEKRFPAIGRIADVAWLPRKLIFEVQCSPISPEEVAQRNDDYGLLGFTVIWILHDRRFNQFHLTAAEAFLQRSPHYFTNMTAAGEGMIYDRFAYYEEGRRMVELPPLPVDPARPQRVDPELMVPGMPHPIKDRAVCWTCHLAGDLLDRCLQTALYPPYISSYILDIQQVMLAVNQRTCQGMPRPALRSRWLRRCLRPYRLVFQMLLESVCR